MDVAETIYNFSRDSEINVNEEIKCGSFLLEGIPIPPEEERIMNDYKSLQYMLCESGYPETSDRTSLLKSVPKEAISICILSSPADCMAVLLEG
ncbi:hypothetical protein CHS0354_037025 [Potamilus streckersoni]|uniref:Uncharacterized protein n=1 Tax=Potamilus streckersoni TaxID=2493646 RepID=A0AAE0SKF5_9BIVA|nr:hypothetical protein CHS0354_037025 [Potamilus streckersoni]